MRRFDARFVDDALAAIRSIETGQQPRWGRMTPAQMFSHMRTAIRYGLGKEEQTPNEGGFFGGWIAGPLILNGIIKLPKNAEAPKMYDTALPEATPEELEAEMREFLAALEAGKTPPPHPFFGDIGARGWEKLNLVHLDHHLRQFGAVGPDFLQG